MAENTNFIISYTGDFNSINRQLKNFERLNTQIAQKMGTDFAKNIQVINQNMDRLQNRPVFDAKGVQVGTETVAQFSTVFKDANGNLKTFTEQAKVSNGGIQTLSSTMRSGGKVTRTFADEMTTLGKRALLTIPIWLVLRTAILSVFTSIRDGLKNIIEFDQALQKIRRNLAGTPEEIAKNFEVLRKEITDFSIQTGISTESLAEAVKKFASLGFQFEEALAGGLGAAKLSIVLFGDAAETSDSFARALNLLIDRTKGAKAPIQQMNELFALTAELEKTNQFEIKEVNESLKNFAGTAKSLGITGKETLAILASLGTNLLEGARGGTLASSAFQQLINNLEDVSAVLGIKVNPQVESTTDIFVKVIDEIERLGQTNIVAQTSAIDKLFGGLKGAKPVRALISDLKRLKENLQVEGDVGKFNKQVDDLLNNSLQKLVDRFHNVNKEAGKAFVNGLVGGKDFIETMQLVNQTLEHLIPIAKEIGGILRASFSFGTGGIFSGKGFADFDDILNKAIQDAASVAPKALDDLSKEINTQFLKALNKNLKRSQINDLLLKLTTFGANELKIDPATFNKMVTDLQQILNETPLEVEVQPVVARESLDAETVQEIGKAILKDQLARLKTAGATTAELLKQENILVKQLGIEEKDEQVLNRKLETQRAIGEEQRLQNRLSSDSIKLFEIAQTSGTSIAKEIGDVLAGTTNFDTFVRRGGEAVEIFKRDFEDVFKQQQAQAFFRGDVVPGAPGLRGGSDIAIEETALRGLASAFNTSAALQKAKLEADAIRARDEGVAQTANIQALQFNTQSIENLTQAFNSGVALFGTDAQRFVAANAPQTRQVLDVNVNIDGRNLAFSGSPEAIRQLAATLSPQIQSAVENSIVNQIENNPESRPAQAVNKRIENF